MSRWVRVNSATHDADAQEAQLQFLRDDAQRQQALLTRRVVSPSDAERASILAKAQEKVVEAARTRIIQAKALAGRHRRAVGRIKSYRTNGFSFGGVKRKRWATCYQGNREVATLLLPAASVGSGFCPRTLAWFDQTWNEQVRVRVDSFPGKDFSGTVEQINRQAEFTPRNVQTVEDRIRQVFGVKVRLDNSEDKLRAGMAADVYFPNVK